MRLLLDANAVVWWVTDSARLTVTSRIAIADPTIPAVAGEPGATFVFSQILGINDEGIAVGYYGDSTGSQHGSSTTPKPGRMRSSTIPRKRSPTEWK